MDNINAEWATPIRTSDGKGGYLEAVPAELKRLSLEVEYHGNELEATTEWANGVAIGDMIKL